MSISKLDKNCALSVLDFCDYSSVCNYALASRSSKNLAYDAKLWERLVRLYFSPEQSVSSEQPRERFIKLHQDLTQAHIALI